MRNAVVEITCPFCHKAHYVEVNRADYYRWRDGELIQNVMPDLSPTERE